MRKHLKTLAVGAAIVAGLAAAPAPHAQDYLSMPDGSMMGQGMMGQDMMGMMGSMMSGMMNMMGMSGDMDEMGGMMEQCSTMMQGMDGQRPNEQWQDRQPERPQPEGNAG
jgi:hypothetical protein